MLTPGTIAVTKNSSTIAGTGTDFGMSENDNIDLEGKYIKVVGNNEWYMIKTVTSDTAIVLDRAYRGETASGQYYELGGDQMFLKPDILGEDEADDGLFILPWE